MSPIDCERPKCTSNGFVYYIRLFRDGSLLGILDDGISGIDLNLELNQIPTAELRLPMTHIELFQQGRVEILCNHTSKNIRMLFRQDAEELIFEDNIIRVPMIQILSEWQDEIVSVNKSVKATPIQDLYNILNPPADYFGRDLWSFVFEPGLPGIEYTFSARDKLQSLGDVIKNTRDTHFRIPLFGERDLEIGRFLDFGGVIAAEMNRPATADDLSIPIINIDKLTDLGEIVNELVVLGGNNANGYAQLTLREIFDLALDDPNFPVSVAVGFDNNNDEVYGPLDDTIVGPNNTDAFIIRDLQGVADENGNIYRQTINFKDLYPIPDPDQPMVDADRIIMAQQAYERAIRKLVDGRRKITYRMETGPIPDTVNVGDAIRVIYRKQKEILDKSCNEIRLITVDNIDEIFFIRKLVKQFDDSANEINVIDLTNNVRALQREKSITQSVVNNNNERDIEGKQRQSNTQDVDALSQGADVSGLTDGLVYPEVTKDLVYFLEWKLRLVTSELTSTSAGVVTSTSLAVNSPANTGNTTVPPDNHSHTIGAHSIVPDPHTHSITNGVFPVPSVPTDFRLFIDGIDFTATLRAQFAPPLDWPDLINGFLGLFPNAAATPDDKYDLIQAAIALGATSILQPGTHTFKFTTTPVPPNSGLVHVEALEYKQLSQIAR